MFDVSISKVLTVCISTCASICDFPDYCEIKRNMFFDSSKSPHFFHILSFILWNYLYTFLVFSFAFSHSLICFIEFYLVYYSRIVFNTLIFSALFCRIIFTQLLYSLCIFTLFHLFWQTLLYYSRILFFFYIYSHILSFAFVYILSSITFSYCLSHSYFL